MYEIKTIEDYQESLPKKIRHKANELFMYNNYMVGKEPDFYSLYHTQIYLEIMCNPNCTLVDVINKKLVDKLECKKYKCTSDLVKEYRKCHKKYDCTDTEIIKECCEISNIGETEW